MFFRDIAGKICNFQKNFKSNHIYRLRRPKSNTKISTHILKRQNHQTNHRHCTASILVMTIQRTLNKVLNMERYCKNEYVYQKALILAFTKYHFFLLQNNLCEYLHTPTNSTGYFLVKNPVSNACIQAF